MKDLNRTTIALGLAFGVGVGGQAMAQADCDSVDLLFNKILPDSHVFYEGGIRPWAEDVARVTDGRVTVSFTSAALAPPAQQWTMVTDGIADVALMANPFELNRLQLPNIAGLPFTGNLAAARSIALWRTQQEHFNDANEYDGVHLLSQFTNAGAGIISSKMINGMEDIQGLKLWSIGGQPASVVDGIGAVPVPAPGAEMFSLYSKGVVDGIVSDWGAMKVYNTFRYTKNYVDVPGGLYAVDFSLYMSQDKWDSICPSDQELVSSVSGETIARNIGEAVDELGTLAQTEVGSYDIKVSVPDEAFTASLKDATKFTHDAWIEKADARGINGGAALTYFLEQVEAVTSEKVN